MPLDIAPFYDPRTHTFSYVIADSGTRRAAAMDPVLDYEPRTGRIGTESVRRLVEYIREHDYTVDWILETHAHADHLSGAARLQEQVGGKIAAGAGIRSVQETFSKIFNLGPGFPTDGSQFDRLLNDGEEFAIGTLTARVLATPGHTDDSITYLIGDAAFIGDTLFRPDYGTARCDFPGGDARKLYESVQRLYALPPETRLFLCHDYPAAGAEPRCEVSVQAQREGNVMLRHDTPAEEFVRKRTARDKQLDAPELLLPALQVNIRAGHLPAAESNGQAYFKIPLSG